MGVPPLFVLWLWLLRSVFLSLWVWCSAYPLLFILEGKAGRMLEDSFRLSDEAPGTLHLASH